MEAVDAPQGTEAMAASRIARSEGDTHRSRLSNVTLAAELVGRNHVQLSWVAAAALVGLATIPFLAGMWQHEVRKGLDDPIIQGTLIAAILITIVVILIERFGWLKPMAPLRAGLMCQIVIAATIAVFENAIAWQPDEYIWGRRRSRPGWCRLRCWCPRRL